MKMKVIGIEKLEFIPKGTNDLVKCTTLYIAEDIMNGKGIKVEKINVHESKQEYDYFYKKGVGTYDIAFNRHGKPEFAVFVG